MTGQGDGLAALFTLVHPEPPVLNIDVLDPHGVGRSAPRFAVTIPLDGRREAVCFTADL